MLSQDLSDLAIVDDDVVAAFSRETYVFELQGVTRLSIAIHAQRPVAVHLVKEKEWLQWQARQNGHRTQFDGSYMLEVSATTLAVFQVAITASPKLGLTTVVLIVSNPGAVRSSFHLDVRSSRMEPDTESASRKSPHDGEDGVAKRRTAGV